ncbi:hypothetical protein Ngar_c05910 [Candidatus Nitrososphaera gargensis Ga9.2]|uniref:Polysaccharide deacetylase n=1 Tax=Nitrososphaera gargensis (strain Ga9.2) TaxID=1237085 RepID=K0IM38_NITGG|nr:hypothetical protein [Candidatus Nitrososphaera gargensis]AFU57534.1 hypothetical protein Ngar_c05910 [Candidatus Nitrososphaera gargensis Ga9.2]
MIALTADTDWVPEKILNYFLDILDEYDATITIFATHEIDGRHHEIALHPNLETTYNKEKYQRHTSLETAEKLKKTFPQAIGMRSHGLNVCTDMLLFLPKIGLKYDSSYIMPFQDGIKPYIIYPGVLEIPIYWMDIEIMRFGKSLRFDSSVLREQQKSSTVYVYDFHPSHVFTNTCSLDFYYNTYRPNYHNVDFLEDQRNTKEFGAQDALVEMLEILDNSDLHLMSEIYEHFRNGQNSERI